MGNNNGNGRNYVNNNNGYNGQSQEAIIKELTDAVIPLSFRYAGFEITTPNLSRELVNVIKDTFGIPEIDEVFMYPVYNSTRQLVDFGCVLYFVCDQNGNGNIYKMGGNGKGKATRTGDGGYDLSRFISNNVASGNYGMSELFKQKIGSIACKDDNGDIIVNADPDDKRIAIVDVDFWLLMGFALKIEYNSPLKFVIETCAPLNTKSDCIDYVLSIRKEYCANGKRRGRHNAFINYDARNRELLRRKSNRR